MDIKRFRVYCIVESILSNFVFSFTHMRVSYVLKIIVFTKKNSMHSPLNKLFFWLQNKIVHYLIPIFLEMMNICFIFWKKGNRYLVNTSHRRRNAMIVFVVVACTNISFAMLSLRTCDTNLVSYKNEEKV